LDGWYADGLASTILNEEDERYRLEVLKYGESKYTEPASERARALYNAWNVHKTERANYKEDEFHAGRLGLTYSALSPEPDHAKKISHVVEDYTQARVKLGKIKREARNDNADNRRPKGVPRKPIDPNKDVGPGK